MIEFMVIAAPRSGTAWAANWLTTDTTLCLHDPLWQRHYLDLDHIESPKVLGVACTGLALFEHFTSTHSARKVILHRNFDEIDASLAAIGMPPTTPKIRGMLDKIEGMHVHWRELFERPQPIYEFLLHRPFDPERHAMLCDLEVQTNFERIKVNPQVTARLIAEMQAATQERLQ